jgi:hypothetical protein
MKTLTLLLCLLIATPCFAGSGTLSIGLSGTAGAAGGSTPAWVQNATMTTTGGSTATSLAIGGAGWGANNGANNLIVVSISSYCAGVWTWDAVDVTDNKAGGSNTYTLDAVYPATVEGLSTAQWSTINTGSGAKLTITIAGDNTSGYNAYMTAFAAEFSGTKTSAYVGASATNTGPDANANVTVNVGTANSMVVTTFALDGAGGTVTPGAGWGEIGEDEGASGMVGAAAYKLATGTGNLTHTWTSPDNVSWVAVGVEYKAGP